MLLLLHGSAGKTAAAAADVDAPQQTLAQPSADEDDEVAVAGAIEAEAAALSQLPLLLFGSGPLFVADDDDDDDVVVAVAGVENFFLRSYGGDD